MSSEELKSLKEEIYSSITQFEKKILENFNFKTKQLTDDYDKFNQKLEYIISNNKDVIEKIVSEKINVEKLNALESFKNKADGILISHEIRINNDNKDINHMKEKYDRAIEENLLIPGFIGPKCQFQNVKEYINSNNSDISRLKYEKEQLKLDTKEVKNRLDNLFKQMLSLVDTTFDRSREYTNTRITENKNYFENKVDAFNERANELRFAISQTKMDIETQVDDLKLETEKIKSFLEKTKILEQNIKKTNDDIMKVNYDINKLYDKNNDFDKKLLDLKNEISKIKVMSEIKNKSRNIQNNMRMREQIDSNTFENIKKEINIFSHYNTKNFSEKKDIKNKNKKQYDIRNQKIDFNNKNQEEKKGENKTALKKLKEKDNKIKLNMLINKHMMKKISKNNFIINYDEEKTETIISEESLLNSNNNKIPNDIININEFSKTMIDNRIHSRNEDIIHINHNYKESLNKDEYIIENNNINISPKKSKLIEKKVSEIKFDAKTKSLKKKIYNITSESTFFPKIDPIVKTNNIIDTNQNIMISNIQNENLATNNNNNEIDDKINNSISIESKENNNIDSINNQLNKETNDTKIKNNIEQKSIINNKIDLEQKKSGKTTSRTGSKKNLNEINIKTDNLSSYRSNKKLEINSEPLLSNNNQNKSERSPKYFEENKYLLSNVKKIKKKLNLSHLQDKKVNTNINSNYFNSDNLNINKMCYSPIDYPKGINLVGLNDDYMNRTNSSDEDFYFDTNREPNLKLERIGIASPNSQKSIKKKFKLQGISTEAPLKISAAFGRTMYTFIDKNNTKNIYSIKTIKKKPENEKLNIYLGSNNTNS